MFNLKRIVPLNVNLKIRKLAMSKTKGKFCKKFKEELVFLIFYGMEKMEILTS
jgi:hypothetical protein